MTLSRLPDYIQYLLEKCCYPHSARRVELVQTHISYIVLADDFVYKWKKPVNFGFLDFSTLEKRKYFCAEEFRLNLRLCPDIYLGVVRITRNGMQLSLEGRGEPVEYGVKMKRLPEERMMNKVIAAGRLKKHHLEQVINILATFYASLDALRGFEDYGGVKAVSKTIHDNFAETSRFVGGKALSTDRFLRIRQFTEHFLSNEDLFQQRVNSGRVRECHGDLHSGNICLTDRVTIFDCIEFSERLRCTDIAADVAFLAMDLDFHNLHELSDFFIHRFIERTEDEELSKVLNFYKCYRAYVRGKIGLLTAADPGVEEHVAACSLRDAERYFRLAEQYGAQ